MKELIWGDGSYPKMPKHKLVKPLKKDLELVDAFGVAPNPMASPRGWLFRVDSLPSGVCLRSIRCFIAADVLILFVTFQIVFRFYMVVLRLHHFIFITPLYLVDFNSFLFWRR